MHEIHQKRESPVRCTERVDYNENQHREFWGERTGNCFIQVAFRCRKAVVVLSAYLSGASTCLFNVSKVIEKGEQIADHQNNCQF